MASHSPQRARRPQTQQVTQGAMLAHQAREASPSPTLRDRDRPRALKTQSMPMVPSIANFPPQPPQPSQNPPQPSPTIQNGVNRRPTSPLNQITRLLPTPPHNNPPSFEGERRLSPPPGPQQTMSSPNVNAHYSRPGPRPPAAPYPTRLQNLEDEWKMPEILADIELAADQHQQYQSNQQQQQQYPQPPSGESPQPVKGPNVERVRGVAERSSPINPDSNQQRGRRDQQIARESPKARDRQPASPNAASFALTPERRMTPSPLLNAEYGQHYSRESPPVHRRPVATDQRLNPPMGNQSSARAPDRSLPVQEEDEHHHTHDGDWQAKEESFSASPTPSSDLNPDGSAQRFEGKRDGQQVHREDEDMGSKHDEDSRPQYAERDSTEEDSGGFTPRSPTAGLPEDHNDYYTPQGLPIRVPVPMPPRHKGRNGSSDNIMRGLESTLMDGKQPQSNPTSSTSSQQQQQQSQPHVPQQYVDSRQQQQQPPVQQPPPQQQYQQAQPPPQQYQMQQQPNPHQYPKYASPHDYYAQEAASHYQNGRYYPQPQVYPDDFHSSSYSEDTTSAYIQSYLGSPRPDAPIPPTPHSQTAAPSPAPMPDYPAMPKGAAATAASFRPPVRAAGSPYPFPFNHVRRNRQNQNSRLIANGLDPATITEQIARQWQVFAQNNQGNITDSTMSPSGTPFQGDLYDHWAYLHTNRMMRGMHDTMSIHSSPSHQPVTLPVAPNFSARKKNKKLEAKRDAYNRKPPPRVESTQPRETSPELSSSGEETAGEDRLNGVHADTNGAASSTEGGTNSETTATVNMSVPIEIVNDTEDSGEWVDEEDEDDYEDLIDLEYHPAFIKNITRRRRKWEVGWENLIQAFQALDRQTDATMILLASPSHSTKLHALRSRSIRRQSGLNNSSNMDQIRAGFARISSQRRTTRPEKTSLIDRLAASSSTGDGSDGSSGSVEDNLRRALDAALGSLGALGEVYEQREARVMEELQRSRDDRERIDLVLRQVLGEGHPLINSRPLALNRFGTIRTA